MHLEGFYMGILVISCHCLYFALMPKMCICGIDKAMILS